jgi:hypothetical protein
MNKLLSSLALSGLFLVSAGPVSASPMDIAFANTIVLTAVTERGETAAKYYYEPDGTVTVDFGTGTPSNGTWSVVGDEVCTSYSMMRPGADKPMEQKNCSPVTRMESAQIGDTWEFSPSDKITIKGEVVAGR